MFSHVTVGSRDVVAALEFYDAILTPLGITQHIAASDTDGDLAGYAPAGESFPSFYVCRPLDDKAATVGNGTMVAFEAASAEIVDIAFDAGIAAGGSSEGAPGPRDHYAKGYYGAYLRDLDGNKVHLVYRGDIRDAISEPA